MANLPPDWQLPPGVSRGLWDYLHDSEQIRSCDDRLAQTPLLQVDQSFVEQHCPRPGHLIDLGCGTGRLLVPMALKGHRVLGVDLSTAMLRVAAAKAVDQGLTVPLLQANLVELDCLADQSFDHAVCLFSTLGMVTGAANRQKVVAHAWRLLKPGGIFILHVHNRWFSAWDRGGRRRLFRDQVRSWTQHPAAGDRPMAAVLGDAALSLHHFTRHEAITLLQGTGFRLVEVRPLSLAADGRLRSSWWFGWLRAYGYLIAARRE